MAFAMGDLLQFFRTSSFTGSPRRAPVENSHAIKGFAGPASPLLGDARPTPSDWSRSQSLSRPRGVRVRTSMDPRRARLLVLGVVMLAVAAASVYLAMPARHEASTLTFDPLEHYQIPVTLPG